MRCVSCPAALTGTMGSPPPYDSKTADLEAPSRQEPPSAPGVVEDVVQVVDHKAERALCWKFDVRLLPILALMCMPFLRCVGREASH